MAAPASRRRQPMVGMGRVGKRGLDVADLEDVLERGRRGFEAGCKLARLLGDVIAVEAVEPGVAIAVCDEQRLPRLPGRRQRVGCERLDHDDLRPEVLPIAAEQHVPLGAFDVDLEEIEGSAVRAAGTAGAAWSPER